jgi:glycosyltransferase involved in cell wall biosynthesis
MNEAGASTFVVLAAYNEAPAIGPVLDDLVATCPDACIVVVDDGSSDGTAGIASRYPVRVLRHVVNRGQGAALATGFEYALARGAEILVTFDADGQMAASDIARVCLPITMGQTDVVLGTRFSSVRSSGMPVSRLVTLRLGTAFTRMTSGLPLTDTYNGLRAFSRSAAERLRIRQDRMGHGLELVYEIARHGLRWREMPVSIRYTEYSRAKGLSSLAAIDIVADLLAARR